MKTVKKMVACLVSIIILTTMIIPSVESFAASEYTVSITKGLGGSVTPNGDITVAQRTSLTTAIIPDNGYVIDKITVDNNEISPSNEYNFTNILSNHTMNVTFKKKVTYDVNGDGYYTNEDCIALASCIVSGDNTKKNADINSDGSVDLIDLVLLKKAPTDLLTENFGSENWQCSNSNKLNTVTNNGNTFEFDTTEYSTDSAYYKLKSSGNWSDYQVECDFLYENYDYTKKSSYLALVARKSVSKNYSYEFRLNVAASDTAYITGEFYKRSDSTYTLLKTFDSDYIQNIIGAKKVLLDKSYNLKILCIKNDFYFFIDNNYLGYYTDNDNPYLTGSVGAKSYRAKGSFSNFKVTNRVNRTYKNIFVCDAVNNKVSIRSGNAFNFDDYKLSIMDFDGSILTSFLSENMIKVPSLKNGSNTATITAFGMNKKIDIYVSSNSVSGIDTRLVSNKDKNVNSSSAVTYKNLIRDVDKCSQSEFNNLSDDAKTGYNNLTNKLAKLNVPFGDIITNNAFNTNDNNFSSKFETKKGKQYVKNGKMYISQIPYGISTNCYYFDDSYGELSSVSADFVLKSYNASIGLMLNATSKGYFLATLSLNKNYDDINARNSATVRIYRKDANGQKLIANNTNVNICRNENFNFQITYNNGVVNTYLNYSLVSSSSVQDDCNIFDKGYGGVLAISGDITVDNYVVCGNELQKETSADIETTYYSTDFNSDTIGTRPSEWLEKNNSDNWAVQSDSDSKYYGTKSVASVSDDVLFSDDFNSYGNNASGAANKDAMIAKGWNAPNNTTGNYNNSTSFVIPAQKSVNLALSNLEGADEWSDYSVSADVKINDNTTGASYTYISGRINNSSGYWLRVWTKDGTVRSLELQSFSNFIKSAVLGTYTFSADERIPYNNTFNIKMVFIGNEIKCYFNNRLLIDVFDNAYRSGYCGFYTSASNVSSVTIDNYVVNNVKLSCPQSTNTYLHIFESNPVLSSKIRFNTDGAENSDFGFVFRNSPETSYLKLVYDIKTKKWYVNETLCVEDLPTNILFADTTCELNGNTWYQVKITVKDKLLTLEISNDENDFEYSCSFNLLNISTGRVGLFTNNTLLDIDDFSLEMSDGGTVQEGIIEYTLYNDKYAANFEIEQLDGNNMIGVGSDVVGISNNLGATFDDATADYSFLTDGAYPSLLKLHDGTYLRVNSSFEVYSSSDYMQTWIKVCSKITEYKSGGKTVKIFHSNSLTEVKLSNGNYRIFLPIATRRYKDKNSTTSTGHYTEIYYSDDGGKTWSHSSTDTKAILYNSQNDESSSWSESKIISCDDGTLRMYYSRNTLGVMQYTVSNDNGLTWSGLYQIPEMQCAASSFSIIKDNSESAGETEYYLVWVNDNAVSLGSYFSRSRLSLAHSTDGKTWEFLCNVERMQPEVYSDDLTVTTPLFQIVDPSIAVNDDYVYISYGRSESSGTSFHNSLRINVARIEKSKLVAKEWNASNIANIKAVKKLSFVTTPKTSFALNETFNYGNAKVLVECLDGSSYEILSSKLHLLSIPDTSISGKKNVVLYNENGFSLSYEITVGALTTFALPTLSSSAGINTNIASDVSSCNQDDDLDNEPKNQQKVVVCNNTDELLNLSDNHTVTKSVISNESNIFNIIIDIFAVLVSISIAVYFYSIKAKKWEDII